MLNRLGVFALVINNLFIPPFCSYTVVVANHPVFSRGICSSLFCVHNITFSLGQVLKPHEKYCIHVAATFIKTKADGSGGG